MQIKTLAKAMLIALVVMIAVPSQHLSAQVSQAPMGEKMKKGRPKFNPKEIEKKLRKHLSKAADLSPEEQAVVFPIFFEMKAKMRDLHGKSERAMRRIYTERLTERDASRILDEVQKMRQQAATIEVNSYERMRKANISSVKIIKIIKADDRFAHEMFRGMMHRDKKKDKGDRYRKALRDKKDDD